METLELLGQEYHPRIIDSVLDGALESAGAVVIEGARASGKTMTAMHAAQSFALIDASDTRQLIEIAPQSVLDGRSPRLLDEWQLAPELWNLVRRAVDASPEHGRFILTGSAVPADDLTRHTGAGRFLRLRQRTMAWAEKLDVPRSVSLEQLFGGSRPQTDFEIALDLDAVIEALLRPGFPALAQTTPAQGAQRLRAYIDDVARADVPRLAAVRHEPSVIKQLIVALARSVASEVSFTTLAKDVRAVAPSINVETISTYVDLLQRLFLVEAQPPWAPGLRSRARVRTSSKIHLVDPALTAAALGAGPERLAADLETTGLLFESAVVHDLMVLSAPLEGEVFHYRDSNGREIDAVITLPDGRWGAVEIKLGGRQLPAAIASLDAAIRDIDTTVTGSPSFRLVVTGTGPVLVTDDGTITAPLSALAP